MASLAADALTLRHEVGAVRVDRDVIEVVGPDASEFLEGQLSQEIASLVAGASTWSLLLSPQGRVDAQVRLTRSGEAAFLLDVEAPHGEEALARLERFKLRVECELTPHRWELLAVRGAESEGHRRDAGDGAVVVADADWPGVAGFDLVGPDPQVPDGVPACDPSSLEVVRIEAGVPAMGSELTERTMPGEAGIVDRTVSFTKGCFVGQELVARIDSRGAKPPRLLRGVVFEGDRIPESGAVLRSGEAEAGVVTSAARSEARGAPVALAYVKRAFEPAAEVIVDLGDHQPKGVVETLPLVS